jgi:ubiquinol-cytochrome c reductase cytochrome c1 subunit
MKIMTKIFSARAVATVFSVTAFLLSSVSSNAVANEGGYPLDHFPTSKLTDQSALQNGAKLFVNYCLNCHSAQSMRYNRLRDIGLSDDNIRANLMFAGEKVGDPMKTTLAVKDAKEWFGAVPPDLSVIARARSSEAGSGSDWVYTYLRTYFRDSSRATGWNNAVYPNVGMPHVLWDMQGPRGAKITEVKSETDVKTKKETWKTVEITYDESGVKTETSTPIAEGGHPHASTKYEFAKPSAGKLSQAEYDSQIADLVAYLTYMSDPSAKSRSAIGGWVLFFLLIFTILAWALNRNYWKDIK